MLSSKPKTSQLNHQGRRTNLLSRYNSSLSSAMRVMWSYWRNIFQFKVKLLSHPCLIRLKTTTWWWNKTTYSTSRFGSTGTRCSHAGYALRVKSCRLASQSSSTTTTRRRTTSATQTSCQSTETVITMWKRRSRGESRCSKMLRKRDSWKGRERLVDRPQRALHPLDLSMKMVWIR